MEGQVRLLAQTRTRACFVLPERSEMTAPPRARTTRPHFGLPTIPRRTAEKEERRQIQYLVWRLEAFLNDARASKRRVAEFREACEAAWTGGATYARMCEIIEEHMTGFLAAQANGIQSIYNEK